MGRKGHEWLAASGGGPPAGRRRVARGWWWLIAVAAVTVYLVALVFVTGAALTASSFLRREMSSEEFRQALEMARHPITEADLPRLLPDIPVYPGAKLDPMFMSSTTRALAQGQVRIHLVAPASRSQVRQFYRAHMAGWTPERLETESGTLAFTRPGETCFISLMPSLPFVSGGGAQFIIMRFTQQRSRKAAGTVPYEGSRRAWSAGALVASGDLLPLSKRRRAAALHTK